ncbi:hypothetical protein ACJ8PQ_13765, partial [Serratia sp. CY74664]|uniref:hypothetical protein n=1 Tax=Serratia sp. CY74664 TaxID=3383676 RepID=UPI003F9FCF48
SDLVACQLVIKQIQLLIQLLSHFLRQHNDSFYFAGHEFNFRALCPAAVKIKTPYLHPININYLFT